ncbi:MAG: hypothetical protein R2851_17670 [Caldilineaceae bacterium]
MFSKADTHMHTTCSDGLVSPEELVDYVAAQTDLRICIFVTDHDTAEGGLRLQNAAAAGTVVGGHRRPGSDHRRG